MIRTRALLTVAFAAFAAAVFSGCDLFGGGEDPQKVMEETFANETKVTSGVIDLKIEGSAEGAAGGSASASLSGPFQGDPENENAVPQLDLTASADASGAGQSFGFTGGLTVTQDNAFVEYGNQAYEVGTATFEQFKTTIESAAAQAGTEEGASPEESFRQGCEQAIEQAGGGDTAACEIDFNTWLTDLSDEGTEDIGGVSTTHIHADLDVEQMVEDFVEIGKAAGSPESSLPTEDQIRQVTDAVTEASFDLYSGEDDRILRGLDLSFTIDPSAIPGASEAGVDSASASFSLRLTEVNEDQTITAPENPKPIADLLGQFDLNLGDLGSLGGGLPFGPTGPSGAGGASSAADSQAAQEYLDCVAQNPDDVQQCQHLLTP